MDALAGRSEFYTAYTPYQAEASQGSLQAFFEFQTLICQLTGMDVANASLYEGGSAVAEAVVMAMGAAGRHGKVLVAEGVHPEYRRTLTTYLANLEPRSRRCRRRTASSTPTTCSRAIDDQTACVVVQHPNFFGCLEEVEALAKAAHAAGALFVVSYDPISLGLLKRPGQYGADIAVAEGQCLGNPMTYGGPYLGLLSCREQFVRQMPGRLVGQTVDRNGKRCWVLTLQTREQHIRREKATSNICTNQGLMALKAAVYLAALGRRACSETAELCIAQSALRCRAAGEIPGVRLRFARPFFKEFTLQLPARRAGAAGNAAGGGLPRRPALGRWLPKLDDCISVAVTEKRTRAEIDGLTAALAKALSPLRGGAPGHRAGSDCCIGEPLRGHITTSPKRKRRGRANPSLAYF